MASRISAPCEHGAEIAKLPMKFDTLPADVEAEPDQQQARWQRQPGERETEIGPERKHAGRQIGQGRGVRRLRPAREQRLLGAVAVVWQIVLDDDAGHALRQFLQVWPG